MTFSDVFLPPKFKSGQFKLIKFSDSSYIPVGKNETWLYFLLKKCTTNKKMLTSNVVNETVKSNKIQMGLILLDIGSFFNCASPEL